MNTERERPLKIIVESQPSQDTLEKLGTADWSIWEKEVSSFPWTYEMEEVCYILEGSVTVTPEDGEPVSIKSGDLVTFPQGMSCFWNVSSPIRKHYLFR